MPIEILMPALSPTMTEGNLVKWLVTEGAQVSAGDSMAEIETDKAIMEVEAVDEGIIGKILVAEGTENVQVNSVIAILLEEGEDVTALEGFESSTPAAEVAPAAEETRSDAPVVADVAVADTMPGTGTSDTGTRVFATPLARRLAADKGLQLENIQGSGPHGRIVQSDVEGATAGGTLPSKALAPLLPASAGQSFEDRPISNMRKVIAKRLLESKQTVPHFYLTVEIKIDELLQVRKRINEGLVDEKITVNDFIIRAVGLSLRDVPDANASWLGDAIRYYQQADVAVAVAIEDGLITPIVKSANLKSILMISREVKELVGRAKTGKLKPEEFQGGTFSISNLGMFGIKEFSAIINPPQACILAVGAGAPTPVMVDGNVVGATVMSCTLSVDHRVVDGKVGAELLSAFKRYMENPLLMMA